jgi:4-hydroxythreonine-4-phosphate dehydrogenase
MKKPVIAIAMGDVTGIGPELVVKVLSQEMAWDNCSPLVVGDPGVMGTVGKMVGANLRFRTIEDLSGARFSPPEVDVLRPEGIHVTGVPWGRVDPAAGKAAALCLQKAFELAMDRQVQGVVSAPLNKEAFHRAGYGYADELEFLADLTKSPETFILGVANSVWTVAVTEHVSFRGIADLVTEDRVLSYIGKLYSALKRAGFTAPRIAVAALNVHAGEGGHFGREEIEEIEPAIDAARAQGIDAQGPVPADMVFVRALAGDFDGVVFMYHDQANIARKLQPKGTGATLFMGLPVVCGTTAHGTAFDIAGKGIADSGSLQAALRYTVQLSQTQEVGREWKTSYS